MIKLIMAVDGNWGIGRNGQLLYHFPADLKRFKLLTINGTLVMGRNTWESLPGKLPWRRHVVLSSAGEMAREPDLVLNNIMPIVARADRDDIWVIGGAEVCRAFLPYYDRIELTRIHDLRPADTTVGFLEDALKGFKMAAKSDLIDTDRMTGVATRLEFLTYVRI